MMEVFIREILKKAFNGLHCDGGHHKQWFLEEIVKTACLALRLDPEMLKFINEISGYCWEDGIAP